MDDVLYWLWLSNTPQIGAKTVAALLSHYETPENVYNAPKGELERILPRDKDGAQQLEKRSLETAKEILEKCESTGIDIVTMNDARYPERLRNIHLPPAVLYVKGRLPNIDALPAIAIIGTRRATHYGLKMGMRMGYEIAKCGATVISGLTRGIDSAAAEGALYAEGRVIGVLGLPHELDKSSYSREIALTGALISEYAPGTKPHSSFFRARNRITSGLSLGVAVIEAPMRSGTRLFVNEAADQGKEIFAVPGNADQPSSEGTNLLIKEGAKPVTNGWDVVSEFAAFYPDKLREVRFRDTGRLIPMALTQRQNEDSKAVPDEKRTKKVVDKAPDAAYIDLKKQLEGLSPSQLKIVGAMDEGSLHVDTIIERSGFSPAKVLADLTLLQIKGYVRQETGKRFSLNIKMK